MQFSGGEEKPQSRDRVPVLNRALIFVRPPFYARFLVFMTAVAVGGRALPLPVCCPGPRPPGGDPGARGGGQRGRGPPGRGNLPPFPREMVFKVNYLLGSGDG